MIVREAMYLEQSELLHTFHSVICAFLSFIFVFISISLEYRSMRILSMFPKSVLSMFSSKSFIVAVLHLDLYSIMNLFLCMVLGSIFNNDFVYVRSLQGILNLMIENV